MDKTEMITANEQPLVSIVVITYNSAKYVLETLESAKGQTYPNIELIISDDGSKDNTLEICKEWLSQNKDRFVYTELITVEQNTGIPANCNRAVKASSGEWIKLIAGDDVLLQDCINLNLNFCNEHQFEFCFSDMIYFNVDMDLHDYPHNDNKFFKRFISKNIKGKLISYCKYPLFLNIPSLFYSRKIYELNGCFDEEIKLLEDQPFIIKTLQNNCDIGYLDKLTVKYRKENLTTVGHPKFFENLKHSFTKYRLKELKNSPIGWIIILLEKIRFYYLINKSSHTLCYKIFNKLYYKTVNIFF